MGYTITDPESLQKCPECGRYRISNKHKCGCGFRFVKSHCSNKNDFTGCAQKITKDEWKKQCEKNIDHLAEMVKKFPKVFRGTRIWNKVMEIER